MRWLLIWLSPFAFAADPVAGAGEFYRFKDAQGRTQISDKIPPQYVANGYEILDSRLFVVHRVDPALTANELVRREQAKLLKQRIAQQAAQDRALLDRFPSVADVEAAARSEMGRLELQVEIQSKTLQVQQQSLASLKRRAAREERDGEVSLETLDALNAKEMDVLKAEAALLERRQMLADRAALYDARKARVIALTQN